MFDWLRGIFRRKPEEEAAGRPAGALPSPDISSVYEEAETLRDEKVRLEEELKQEQAAREAGATRQAEEEYAGKVPPRRKTAEEILARLPEKERKKYAKRVAEGEKVQVEAELEIWEAGIPGKKKVMHRVWNPVSMQHEYKEVEVALTPQERLAEARVQRLGGYLIEEEVAELRKRKRERTFPHRAARATERFIEGGARTLTGLGREVAAVSVLGMAGTAQAALPRGEPRRARGFVPSAPPGLYSFGTPTIDLSGIRRAAQPRAGMNPLGGLGHLRGYTLTRVRRPSG